MRDRGVRISQTKRVIKKRLKLVKIKSGKMLDISGMTHYDYLVEKSNILNKQHPMDCGNPKCMMCHREKNLGEQKISLFKKFLSATEQIKESV